MKWWVTKARDSDLYVPESLNEALAKVWHQTRQFIPPTSIHLVQATALRRRQSAACHCRSPLSSESQVSEKYSFCRSIDSVRSEDLIRTLCMCIAPTAHFPSAGWVRWLPNTPMNNNGDGSITFVIDRFYVAPVSALERSQCVSWVILMFPSFCRG